MMINKTTAIVFLLAATLILVGQISINIAQHQAEAFAGGLFIHHIQKLPSKPPSDDGGDNINVQNQNNSGNNGVAQ